MKKQNIRYYQIFNNHIFIVDTYKGKIFSENFLRLIEFRKWHKYYKDKLIDHIEYMQWHKLINRESYDELFLGIFIPGSLLKDFYKKYSNCLNKQEQKLFNFIFNTMECDLINGVPQFNKIQIIGINNELCVKDNYDPINALKHECSHIFYHCNKQYAKLVIDAFYKLNKKDIVENVNNFLLQRQSQYNFNIDVIADEWAAQVNSIDYNKKYGKSQQKYVEEFKNYFSKILHNYQILMEN